jgi:hypothetical protein
MLHVERLTLLYVQYCGIEANTIRSGEGENKVDFQGVVKVGNSGILGGMDVYCLVNAPSFDFPSDV